MLRALVTRCRISAVSATFLAHSVPASTATVCSRGLKESTGLVGIDVDPNGRANLLAASKNVLKVVSERIPEGVYYRRTVEGIFHHWIKEIEGPQSDEALEDVLECQVEELIMMANDELSVIEMMERQRPWELRDGHKPPKLVTEEAMFKEHEMKKP